jgi:hypothetical protein
MFAVCLLFSLDVGQFLNLSRGKLQFLIWLVKKPIINTQLSIMLLFGCYGTFAGEYTLN